MTAEELIALLELQPHPEGGWYRETWRGPEQANGRAVGTAILFLLESAQTSHWHRVDADELWIWQAGDPLVLRIAQDQDAKPDDLVLGPDISAGQSYQGVVPAGHWQAAVPQPKHAAAGFTLVSCVVTPGFEFAGFELAPPGWQPGEFSE